MLKMPLSDVSELLYVMLGFDTQLWHPTPPGFLALRFEAWIVPAVLPHHLSRALGSELIDRF